MISTLFQSAPLPNIHIRNPFLIFKFSYILCYNLIYFLKKNRRMYAVKNYNLYQQVIHRQRWDLSRRLTRSRHKAQTIFHFRLSDWFLSVSIKLNLCNIIQGCTFIVIFGLPGDKHEDDPARALKAGHRILDSLHQIMDITWVLDCLYRL